MDKEYRTGFRLKYGRDNQIIEWLESSGEKDKSYYIREALRYYVNALMPQAPSPSPLPTSASKQVNTVDQKDLVQDTELKEKTDLKENILSWFD